MNSCVLPHTARNVVHINVSSHPDQFRLSYDYTLPLAVFKTQNPRKHREVFNNIIAVFMFSTVIF